MQNLSLKMSIFFILCFFLFCVSVSLAADVLYLKNGRVLIGQTLNASGNVVRFRHKGRILIFKKNVVRKISYGTKEERKVRKKIARRRAAWLKKRRQELAKKKPLVKPITRFDFKEKILKQDVAAGFVSPWTIVARSAIVPGWGHLAMDSPWLGWGYMIASGVFLSNTFYLRNLAQRARADYKRSIIYQNQIIFTLPGVATPKERVATAFVLNGQDYDKSRRSVSEYNDSLSFLFLFYTVQLLHAGFDAFHFGEDVNWNIGLQSDTPNTPFRIAFGSSQSYMLSPAGQRISAGFRFSF